VEEETEQPQGDASFLAASVAEVPGRALRTDDPVALEAWGVAAASLHAASEWYRPSPASPMLADLWTRIAPLLDGDPIVQREYDFVSHWFRQRSGDGRLLVHGDLRPGNAIWDGRTATIIDFDEPCLGWPAYDVARTLLDDEARPWSDLLRHLKTFLRGYQRVHRLSQDEVETLPLYLRLRVLLMYAWTLETEPSADSPWISQLRSLIEQPLAW
jgi:Ser/Thr protein kinase RdoA (MazF antagonist)